MEWPHLIVALILIAGYVIKHIVSTQQEAAAQREQERLRDDPSQRFGRLLDGEAAAQRDSERPQPLAATSDDEVARERAALDQRIEAALQRQREKEELGGEEKPVAIPTVKRYIPIAMPVPRYEPPAPARDRSSVPEVPRVPRSEQPRVVQAPPKATVMSQAARLKLNVPAVAATSQIVLSLPTPSAATSMSPTIRQAIELLRSPQALATAFVLREILDRPVSLRQSRFQSSRGASAQSSSSV